MRDIPSAIELIHQEEMDEITARVDMPLSPPPIAVSEYENPSEEIQKALTDFEKSLSELNGSLNRLTRSNRDTLKNLRIECAKTKESIAGLNEGLKIVVKREAR